MCGSAAISRGNCTHGSTRSIKLQGDVARHVPGLSTSHLKARPLPSDLILPLVCAAAWKRFGTWQWPLRCWSRQTAGGSRQKWRSASRLLRECAALLLAVLHRGTVGAHTKSIGRAARRPEQVMYQKHRTRAKYKPMHTETDTMHQPKVWLAWNDGRPVSWLAHQLAPS